MKHSILLLLIIGQSFIMGMHPPTPKLASLEQESPVGYRDGTFYSSSPPRAVELLPANGVSIDMPSSDDVKSSDGVKSYYDIKSYDEMTRWYDAYVSNSVSSKLCRVSPDWILNCLACEFSTNDPHQRKVQSTHIRRMDTREEYHSHRT
ncbi:hypothetical protein PSTG_12719 [Puccinia striiformis f. sp. tritici PST-78]|uniref:BRCT domain-containing protein n=1 Tax=Puccinia striiformis f. sp. tritici PST-78 TaxID=1165861 RepID=A0A0L0V3Y9_9BASI|nr:hypothetical protein PSTG_12719 [Puccinia striiformis f. sp. tritici PST-78]